jgi:hypothetical protein
MSAGIFSEPISMSRRYLLSVAGAWLLLCGVLEAYQPIIYRGKAVTQTIGAGAAVRATLPAYLVFSRSETSQSCMIVVLPPAVTDGAKRFRVLSAPRHGYIWGANSRNYDVLIASRVLADEADAPGVEMWSVKGRHANNWLKPHSGFVAATWLGTARLALTGDDGQTRISEQSWSLSLDHALTDAAADESMAAAIGRVKQQLVDAGFVESPW